MEGKQNIRLEGGLVNNKIVDALLPVFPDLLAIYQYGSFGTADERQDSDLDLAILATGLIDSVPLWEVAQIVAQIVGRDVDLVDLLSASTVMRLQVVANGRRLYCADENQVGLFETCVFSDYARLNEERHGILEDIERKGSVYGR